jgi:hypothetical protein
MIFQASGRQDPGPHFLALKREKGALNRWTECRAASSLLMDLLSSPLQTDCTRACERGERGRSSDL